jgi:hypothetical protein
MKRIYTVLLVLITLSVGAGSYHYFVIGIARPERSSRTGTPQVVVQDRFLRAVRSMWIPYTNSTTPTLNNTPDSAGNGLQLLSNGRLAIGMSAASFSQYYNTTQVDALISGAGSGTVTSFGKVDGYGITSSVSNPTTTPVHTIAVDTSGAIASKTRLTNSLSSYMTISGTNVVTGLKVFSRASGLNTATVQSTANTATEHSGIQFQNRANVGWDGTYGGLRFSTGDNLKPWIFANSLTAGAGEVARISGTGIITGTQLRISALNTAPASATATGTLGEIRFVNGFLYLCVATNSWQRVALAAW